MNSGGKGGNMASGEKKQKMSGGERPWEEYKIISEGRRSCVSVDSRKIMRKSKLSRKTGDCRANQEMVLKRRKSGVDDGTIRYSSGCIWNDDRKRDT